MTTYRFTAVYSDGETFKRTTPSQRVAEFLWQDVDVDNRIVFAAFFVDGHMERQYIREVGAR
jgi:hypothetical protein